MIMVVQMFQTLRKCKQLHSKVGILNAFIRNLTAFGEGDKYVVVKEHCSSEKPMKFPNVWLRDNCKCSECFHASSNSRSIDWDTFNINVKVNELFCDETQKKIHISWNDNHKSIYDLDWLKQREFNTARKTKYLNEFYRPKTVHWCGADFDKIRQIFEFADIMNNDETLKCWLEALAIYGVATISNTPIDRSVVRQLAERVGFIRKTTYGEEFIVQAKPDAKNFAYLSNYLPLHTDLPYYEYKPSVNILHCMVQSTSEGGSNLLVDGFHLADKLKQEHPMDFKILTETLIDWNDIGSEDGNNFHNIWRSPVICLDSEGNCTRINHSIVQRDSHFSVELDEVLPWYKAYRNFVTMAKKDAYVFKAKAGEVLTFNNIRLLHGRTGYNDTEQNVRYIIGAYLDWDIIYSKLRVLKSR